MKLFERSLARVERLAHIGSWEVDLATGEGTWSDEAYRMIGVEPGAVEPTSKAFLKSVHPEDREAVETGTSEIASGAVSLVEHEIRIIWPNGEERLLLIRIEALRDEDGRVVRMFGTNLDITDRKRAERERIELEAQLQQAQKMESVGRLAGGVAHDFNNMLSVIIGHVDMALEEDVSEQLRSDLQEIRTAATRSAELTRQLLAFARKQTIAPKIIDLNETVSGMINMLQRLIGENINLEWRPQADLGFVLVDPSQIDQILANLCVNARDAIGDVGTICIKTGSIVVDSAAALRNGGVTGEHLWILVRDSGCGMAQDVLDHIFEPFFTTKKNGKGTGLGLSMVYGAVKQNRGFIRVSSELGKGTEFVIGLPRCLEDKPEKRESSVSPIGGHETILLVEDEVAILKLATRMLERHGYTVLAAVSPAKAMQLAAEYPGDIELVATDVIMPGMNGQELVDNLLRAHPNLKYVFMSGYTDDVIEHHGVLGKDVPFLQKPYTTKDLITKVMAALKK